MADTTMVATRGGSSLFAGFSEPALQDLLRLAPLRHLAPGEALLRQGAANHSVYLVEAGELAITRQGDEHAPALEIARLGASEVVGDMSVLRGVPVTATVRAVQPTTVRVFDMDVLAEQPELYDRLRANIAVLVVDRLDGATADIVARHARELRALDTQLAANRFIVSNFICLSFYILTLPVAGDIIVFAIGGLSGAVPIDMLVSLAYIGTFCSVAIRFLRAEGSRFRQYGITLRHWRRQIAVGLAWAAPLLLVSLLLKLAFTTWVAPDAPLFELARSASGGKPSVSTITLLSLIYFGFAFAQEIVRCTIQKALNIFFAAGAAPAPIKTITVSSLMFAATHTHLGLAFCLVAGIAGLYWGALYWRSGSYLAVSTNHGLLGAWAIFILGFPV